MTDRSESIQRIVKLLVISISLFGAAWLLYAGYQWRVRQPTLKVSADMDSLFLACREYKKVVGSYPAGNNADIAKALYGKNDKNLIILIVPKCETNVRGEIIDPWGTPYKFYFAANEVMIRSAGPNRLFEDSRFKEGDDFIRSE